MPTTSYKSTGDEADLIEPPANWTLPASGLVLPLSPYLAPSVFIVHRSRLAINESQQAHEMIIIRRNGAPARLTNRSPD